jgi:hypothetical protein
MTCVSWAYKPVDWHNLLDICTLIGSIRIQLILIEIQLIMIKFENFKIIWIWTASKFARNWLARNWWKFDL